MFRRPIAHTCIITHPQILENLNFFPFLFNVRVEAHPQNFKDRSKVPMGTWTVKYGNTTFV